jgi:hypothetical protein
MRAAKTFGCVDVPEIDPDYLEKIKKDGIGGTISSWPITPAVSNSLDMIYPSAYDHGIHSTLWIGPHTDDSVVGDITLGIIIAGDHYLFTGNGRRVGELVPGTVFALKNKKLHGAFARDMKNPTPLVFATCEPEVAVEDWVSFCLAIDKVIQDR